MPTQTVGIEQTKRHYVMHSVKLLTLFFLLKASTFSTTLYAISSTKNQLIHCHLLSNSNNTPGGR